MRQDPFADHSFDPPTLRVLNEAFEGVWRFVEARTDLPEREKVRNAIVAALIQLAQLGQNDPERLEAYAMHRARAALNQR